VTVSSRTPDLIALTPVPGMGVLTGEQLATLKAATLTVLGEVGVHVPSARARSLLGDHGAHVAADGVVRLPPDLVERALSTAPRSFVLAGREERLDLLLDGRRSYVATEGVGVHVVDPETRALRPSTKADVERLARVCDALPLVGFFWPPVSAQDRGLTAPLHECHAGLVNTLKHVRGATTMRPPLVPYLVEMATVVAGDEAQRRRRPPICGNICTISPLAHDDHGLECALQYAEAGIPFSFMAMTTMGSVAPATALGALVQGDAEVISGLVLAQLAAPGAPVFHSVLVSLMDPYTGGYVSEVPLPVEWMAVELAHAWGVPSLSGGTLSSDDAGSGWLAGRRAGLGAAAALLSGGEICADIGMTGGTMIQYPEQLILQHEVLLEAIGELGGFDFRADDIALDVIRDVGPRGHYLKHPHTRRRLRDQRLAPWLRPGAASPEALAALAGQWPSGAAALSGEASEPGAVAGHGEAAARADALAGAAALSGAASDPGANAASTRTAAGADAADRTYAVARVAAAGNAAAAAGAAAAESLNGLAARASGGVHTQAAAAAALAEFRRLEGEHAPQPLPADVLAELDLVLAAAEHRARRLT
jgi:trimethylamine--corrinoid protein Co-methyltransferase